MTKRLRAEVHGQEFELHLEHRADQTGEPAVHATLYRWMEGSRSGLAFIDEFGVDSQDTAMQQGLAQLHLMHKGHVVTGWSDVTTEKPRPTFPRS